jgi:hypothetical protein
MTNFTKIATHRKYLFVIQYMYFSLAVVVTFIVERFDDRFISVETAIVVGFSMYA